MRKKQFYIWLLLLTGIISCTKEIDIELEEGDRRLVVDAWFTTQQKTHEIRLSQTSDYFSQEETPKVSGADVQIAGGGDLWTFSEVSPGIYHSDDPLAHAKLGNTYTLSITYDGQNYSATDYCDTVPSLDQIALSANYDQNNALDWYDILVWTTELPGYGHWYCWRVLVNSEYVKDTLSEISIESDEYLGDGLTFQSFPIEWIDADEVVSGDTVRLEQHNISKQTYDAFIAILSETEWKGGIFDSPPANVPSNISNDGLGVFVVSAVSEAEVIVP
ncbi:MAG: DUF4249 domain-containing protein [Crocinitomicaceae bacterium]|nr:DUF4249 domain-containing protein [Crocinitomicaceae bacterium]